MSNETRTICFRIPADQADAFFERSQEHGGVSEVLRTFVAAFLDDRMTLKAPKITGGLYK